MSILFLPPLPFSTDFWKDTQKRLSSKQILCHNWNYLLESGVLQDLYAKLDQIVQEKEITCIVGHGYSNALVLSWNEQRHTNTPTIILSNGYIQKMPHPIQNLSKIVVEDIKAVSLPSIAYTTHFLAKHCPSFVIENLFRPSIMENLLSSVFLFRRLVINPYVLDRDTIVLLCQENLANDVYRKNAALFLDNIQKISFSYTKNNVHCIWGEIDHLFPISQIQTQLPNVPAENFVSIDGAAYFHPIERPWAIADHIDTIYTSAIHT